MYSHLFAEIFILSVLFIWIINSKKKCTNKKKYLICVSNFEFEWIVIIKLVPNYKLCNLWKYKIAKPSINFFFSFLNIKHNNQSTKIHSLFVCLKSLKISKNELARLSPKYPALIVPNDLWVCLKKFWNCFKMLTKLRVSNVGNVIM